MTNTSGGGSAALIHLSCFGGFRVTAERPLGGPFLQPGGVAMLAILAAAGDAGISADELRALAWGNLAEGEGRAPLGAALAALWRGGNGDSLLATGDRIAFHPERVTTDVTRFEAACAEEAAAAATEIYEGPYFGGVCLDIGPAFDEWLEQTRARFNTEYQAVVRTARKAARVGAGDGIPDWTAPIELPPFETEWEAPEIAPPMPEVVVEHEAPERFVAEPLLVELGVETAPRPALPRWTVFTAMAAIIALALLIRGRSNGPNPGDAALRRGDFSAARAAFASAVAADSSDAWRWLQLALAADGEGDDSTADAAASRADSLRASLNASQSRLVHGYQLWRSGATLAGIALVDSVAEMDSELSTARALLGEITFRSAPLIGQSRLVARAPLERAVKDDAGAVPAWRRLLQLGLGARDTALAERALAGLRAAQGAQADTSYGWLRSTWSADSTPLHQELARAAGTTSAVLLEHGMLLGVDAGRTTEAVALTEPLLADSVASADRITARLLRAALFAAVEDWDRVDGEVAALRRVWPWGADLTEAATLLAPSRAARPAQLRAVRDRITRSSPDAGGAIAPHPLIPAPSRTLRFYLMGELSARMHDARGVQAAVDSLARAAAAEPELPRRGGSYALTLQSLQLLARGDSAGALARLEPSVAIPVRAQQQLWVNGALERRRRAALLEAAGRPSEGEGWRRGTGAFLVDLLGGAGHD